MSTPMPTELFSKKRLLLHEPDALTAPRGIVTDLGSDIPPADPLVDYVCPRAPPPMPNPTVLTAPRGIVPDFGGDALACSQLLATSASAHPYQIPEQMRFALEVAKLKSTFIYVAPSPANTTTMLPPPPRSTTFAIPTVPPPTARRSTSMIRPPAFIAPKTSPPASPASDGSSSVQTPPHPPPSQLPHPTLAGTDNAPSID